MKNYKELSLPELLQIKTEQEIQNIYQISGATKTARYLNTKPHVIRYMARKLG